MTIIMRAAEELAGEWFAQEYRGLSWEHLDTEQREGWVSLVRVVLAAIREPDDDVAASAAHLFEGTGAPTFEIEQAKLAWAAMIDDILKEGEMK